MGPTDYKPRHSNYQPLRDQEKKAVQQESSPEVSEQRLKHTQQQQSEQELPSRPRILERLRGGPVGGRESDGEKEYETGPREFANSRVSEAQEMRQRPATQEAKSQEPVSASELIKDNATRKHEVTDRALEQAKSLDEIDRS